ncbi:tyrosine-type recombinase/integrase [Clostridium perfringens]|nr:tyrosine-type recombinase/integrase [Clostridium perfringens]EJT6161781.1 tyrosine-type recombinase/integrase [Clostridium perfringens]EJT6504262.1 tyrosine-type recombinase/integrase [Clostridium perfringens]MDK0565409.1 tyrosine-type recombinase/integrase [Clostridium perfringens]MDM0643069.1 tyrosine-type recombinase/integrase [Clostridium perfringens]
MIDNNFAYDYVDDIPWDKNPAFAFSGDSNAYLDAFKNVVDKIPTKDLKISFNDDTWNFNSYFENINDPSLRLIFSDIPEEIKDYCKFFILHTIMNKTKIPTAYRRYANAKSVILSIINNTSHKSIFVITTDDIKNEVINRNNSHSYNHSLYESVYQLYYFLINNYKFELPIELETIKKLGIKEKSLAKIEEENNKIPNIPSEYYNKILKTAINIMKDTSVKYNTRATACMLIILSQTGLRSSDLLALKTTQLFSKQLVKSNTVAHYIHYTAKKPSKNYNNMLEFDIFSNALCTEAFETLKQLRNNCIFSKDNDFLYILDKTRNSKNEFPVSRSRFIKEYKKFMTEFLPIDCLIEWEGIKPSLYPIKNNITKSTQKENIYVPESRQYRVHLCTELYEKGVPLVYIQKYMSHLSEYMMGYYVRPKDTYQENIAYSEKVIREIVKDNVTPLGGSFLGEDIKKNIQDFIKNNNFNVETDIDAIMKAIGDKVIIRGKTGGVCIKTSLMPCSKDARTNELLCSYNLCPNLFHFYYMIDISYLNFKTLQDTYNSSKSKGNTRASQKELNKLKDLLRRRLIPELDELEKEINIKGIDAIIEQHPSLVDIIENKEDIRKEIEVWMKKN